MDWTAEVVGRMHQHKVKGYDLAKEAGIPASYLSTVLNGHKGSEEKKTQILEALERLEARIRSGAAGDAPCIEQ